MTDRDIGDNPLTVCGFSSVRPTRRPTTNSAAAGRRSHERSSTWSAGDKDTLRSRALGAFLFQFAAMAVYDMPCPIPQNGTSFLAC